MVLMQIDFFKYMYVYHVCIDNDLKSMLMIILTYMQHVSLFNLFIFKFHLFYIIQPNQETDHLTRMRVYTSKSLTTTLYPYIHTQIKYYIYM